MVGARTVPRASHIYSDTGSSLSFLRKQLRLEYLTMSSILNVVKVDLWWFYTCGSARIPEGRRENGFYRGI